MTKPSVLPAGVEQSLSALGLQLEAGQSVKAQLPAAIAALATLSPTTISRSAPAIRDAARLHHWRPQRTFWETLFATSLSDKEQLLQLPGLAYLFVFHGDGRIREAALQRMTGGLPNPFFYAAVAIRLNDWADPVRAAALACALRCFPLTAPEVIAATAESLLLRHDSWGRWGAEKEVLEDAFARPDVAAALANLICEARTGPASRILRLVLKRDAMDRYLQTFAVEASQPAVRALAVQTMAGGKAGWISGTEWKWIDKSRGLRILVPTYEFRALSCIADRASLIEAAAADRFAAVRRAALDALIEDSPDREQAKAIAARLQSDKSPSVSERARFILSGGPRA